MAPPSAPRIIVPGEEDREPAAAASPLDAATWSRLALKFGVPAGIAVYLVYFLTQGISADVRTTKELMQRHMHEQRWLLQSICRNLAKDAAQLASCELPPLDR